MAGWTGNMHCGTDETDAVMGTSDTPGGLGAILLQVDKE
jgi:hypothetical protein